MRSLSGMQIAQANSTAGCEHIAFNSVREYFCNLTVPSFCHYNTLYSSCNKYYPVFINVSNVTCMKPAGTVRMFFNDFIRFLLFIVITPPLWSDR